MHSFRMVCAVIHIKKIYFIKGMSLQINPRVVTIVICIINITNNITNYITVPFIKKISNS